LAQGLSARALACTRAGRPVFSGLSFNAAPGDVLQVRGANGAGKSSLLRLLCGLLPAARGSVHWRGRAVTPGDAALATDTAYMAHAGGMNGELSVNENLRFALQLAGGGASPAHAAHNDEVLQRLQLSAQRHTPVHRLSQGQQRRLALARVLLSRRTLWLLDEPCAGLDAQGDAAFAQCLAEHAARGGIAVVTTHHAIDTGTACTRTLDMDQLEPHAGCPPDHRP